MRLRNEWSRFSCHFGRSWGYDHRGVWVDRGCRAEFAVDENRRGHYSGYDYDNRHSGNDKAAVAAGAVALGAAMAAAIVASKNKNRQERGDEAPNWLVGRFGWPRSASTGSTASPGRTSSRPLPCSASPAAGES